MNTSLRGLHIGLVALVAGAGCYGTAGAAAPTACDLLTAAQVSTIVGQTVSAIPRPSPISSGSSMCMYLAGRPLYQLGVTVMETEAVAEQNFKMQQQAAAQHPKVGNRQKGNIVISGIAMNGDVSKLPALLDAAVKNLTP